MSVISEFIDTRRIGEASVTIISDGTLTWTPRFQAPAAVVRQAMPEADPDGALVLGLNVALIQLDDAVVLIDPGCDDPTSHWQTHFATQFPPVERSPGFAAGLTQLGVAPEQVTHVVITHAHGDHYAGVVVEDGEQLVPRFPRARHFLGRADWEDNPRRADPASDLAQRLGLIAQRGLLDLVDGEHELVPGITLLPSPGESPGHLAVRLRSGEQSFYYLGDLFHHPCEVSNLDWAPPGRDPAIVRASREHLLAEITASDAQVVNSHDRFPGWGHIVADDGGYRWVQAYV